MPRPTHSFSALGGVRVHYDRLSTSAYGTRGVPRREYAEADFVARLEAFFAELWAVCGLGAAEVITTAGAYTPKPGRHGLGRAFDLDGVFWKDKVFVTLHDGAHGGDRALYFGMECLLRRHFGQVLDYLYDGAHRDHFHIDDAYAVGFRASSRATVLFLQALVTHVFEAPIRVDGIWGPRTSSALAATARVLEVDADFEVQDNWRLFLARAAQLAFRKRHNQPAVALAAAPRIEPRTPAELLEATYHVIYDELGESAVRKTIESALDALAGHPEIHALLVGAPDTRGA